MLKPFERWCLPVRILFIGVHNVNDNNIYMNNLLWFGTNGNKFFFWREEGGGGRGRGKFIFRGTDNINKVIIILYFYFFFIIFMLFIFILIERHWINETQISFEMCVNTCCVHVCVQANAFVFMHTDYFKTKRKN